MDLNWPEYPCIYLILPEFTWIDLNLHEFTWIYLNLPESAWIYQTLHKFTWIYLNLPEFTRIFLNGFFWVHLGSLGFTWVHMIWPAMLIWVDLVSYWRLWVHTSYTHTYIHPSIFPIYRDPIGSSNWALTPAALFVLLCSVFWKKLFKIFFDSTPLQIYTQLSYIDLMPNLDFFLKFWQHKLCPCFITGFGVKINGCL